MKNLTGQKLYLDTNLFIYALEEIAPWVEITKYVLNAIDSGGCSAITSELTVAECLVKPLELGSTDLVQTYLTFLQNRPFFSIVPVSREIFIQAARLRASARRHCSFVVFAAPPRSDTLSTRIAFLYPCSAPGLAQRKPVS